MKKYTTALVLLLGLCPALMGSCSTPQERKKAGEKITADVVSLSSSAPDSPGKSPSFEYGPKTFALIDDLDRLRGAGLSLLQGGDLEVFEKLGTIFGNAFFVGGKTPVLEYRLTEGVVKPKSSKSLAMLSSMYQFDSLVNELDKISGISASEFRTKYGDFQVLFQPSIVLNADGEQVRKYETTNAAYVAGARQFALFKTSDTEKIPLSFNPQIISHEFGHSISSIPFLMENIRTVPLPRLMQNQISSKGGSSWSTLFAVSTRVLQTSLVLSGQAQAISLNRLSGKIRKPTSVIFI